MTSDARLLVGQHKCPGCNVRYHAPVPAEAACADLQCKHCGFEQEGVERRSRVCAGCGICAICSSGHTVMVRNKGITR